MVITCSACKVEVELPDKVGFRDTCPACHAWLHSCVNCRFWVNGLCTEPSAEKVRDPEGMNYCDWYVARKDTVSSDETGRAKEEAEELWKKLTKK